MPFKARGKCVYKGNKKIGCTKGSVKKYLTALRINRESNMNNDVKALSEAYNLVNEISMEMPLDTEQSTKEMVYIKDLLTNPDLIEKIRKNIENGMKYESMNSEEGPALVLK